MDKYLQYTPLELAENDSFIRWAKGNPREGDLDWDTWLSANLEKSPDIQSAKDIVSSIVFSQETIPKATQEKVWSKINEKISASKNIDVPKTKQKTSIIKWISYGAVAAVALVLLMMNLGSDYDTTVRTPYALNKTVELPDGSKVQINADSKIEYNSKTWSNERTIILDGEAFFSVQKGSKFTVKTNNGDIAVLGTSFNINTRNNLLHVICKTGKVAVTNSAHKTILSPNQSVTIWDDKHDFNKDIQNTDDRSSWKDGSYIYKDKTLATVIGDLERQYDIKINIESNLTKVKYSGGFNTGNLDNSLSEVMWPLGLKFTVNGKKVLVTKD